MAYSKTYSTIIPVPTPESGLETGSDDLLVWLTRESFDRAAEVEALVITSFTDLGEIPPDDIPPKVEKQLGRPATDFVWRSFQGVGERHA